MDNMSLWPAHMYGASSRAGEMLGDLQDSFMSKPDRSTYANPEFDKAIEEAAVILDETERGKAMLKVFKILHDDAAALFLFEPIAPAAYGPRVKSWEMVKTRAWGEYYNLELK
jgi:ABC-type transport system substrate-binding protein